MASELAAGPPPKGKSLAGKGTPPETYQAAAARRLAAMNQPTDKPGGKRKAFGKK